MDASSEIAYYFSNIEHMPIVLQVRNLLSVTLVGLLLTQAITAQQSGTDSGVKQTIAALPEKAHVELQLANGNSERGRIVSRGDTDFALKQDGGAGMQTISYEQVRSVSQIKANHSKRKWIIIGVVAGVVVVVAIIAAVVAAGPRINQL